MCLSLECAGLAALWARFECGSAAFRAVSLWLTDKNSFLRGFASEPDWVNNEFRRRSLI